MNKSEFLCAAKEAAKKAGNMLCNNIYSFREIHYKGAINLVTNFDDQSQKMIYSELSSRFPEHDFLAEEDLRAEKGSEFRWIVDPLDGTTNYAHGFPVFCVSIALEHEGTVILGVVYDPMRKEMFTALQNEGAFLNKKRIKVSDVDDLDKSLLATGFPYDIRSSKVNNIDNFNKFLTRAQAIRRCGSAALDLCYLACGRFDGFWELKLYPWDIAAGLLIVKEAGGQVSDFKGGSLDLSGKEILATNGLIHKQMIKVLQQK